MNSSIKAIVAVSLIITSTNNWGAQAFAPSFVSRPLHRSSSAGDAVFSTTRPGFSLPTSKHRGHHDVTTSRRYSETVDPPLPPGPNFEQRMRDLVQGKTNTLRRPRTRNPMRPPSVHEVFTLEEYKDVVAGADDKLVVVRFYATWCKACRAVAPAFYKMAKKYENDAVFVELPVTEDNANVHQGLGVPSIPFGHIYHPEGGLVEELPLKRKELPRFMEVFKTYLSGSCDIPDGDCSNPIDDDSNILESKRTTGMV